MSEENHRKLTSFIAGQLALEQGRQLVRLDLYAAQPGTRGDLIRTWEREQEPERFGSQAHVEGICLEILKIAEDHADTFGGDAVRFEVRTTQALGGGVKCAFRVIGNAEVQVGGEDSANASGVLGQTIRHNEFLMRMTGQVMQVSMATMQRQIADLVEENSKLRRERVDHLAQLEVAQRTSDERELRMTLELAADGRKDKAFGKLVELAPVVMSRLLGPGSPDGGDKKSSTEILLSGFAKSLRSNPQQITRIAQLLSTEQTVLFVEIMRNLAEQEAKESAHAQQASQAQQAIGAAATTGAGHGDPVSRAG